jgi:hypothetical protein
MRFSVTPLLLSPILALALSGCALSTTAVPAPEAGSALHGEIHGGQQPVAGAHVYIFAANTTGYGQASISLLVPNANTQVDALGAYVLTDEYGDFDITGDYQCTPGSQVYLLARGGNPGAGVNSAIGIMSILGSCPTDGTFAGAIPYIIANEASTIAAAYAMAPFATDALHVSSSGTALAQTGIANAFANAANLVSIGGSTLATTPGGNGTPPQATVNTLANVIAACINTSGPDSSPCTTLFANTLSGGTTGTAPTETATAAINIAHNPAANVANLYFLPPPTSPFAPVLTTMPSDLTIGINFSGGGLSEPSALAIDAAGNVWAANEGSGSVTLLAPNGNAISPAEGFIDDIHNSYPVSVAIDLNGNAWVADAETSSLAEYSAAGTLLSPVPVGFQGGGLYTPQGVAVDGNGNIWAASYANTVSEFSPSGIPESPAVGWVGGGLNGPAGIALDAAGNAWIPNCNFHGITSVSKFSSNGTPLSPANGFLGGGVDRPFAVAIDGAGNVWSANLAGSSLSKFDSTGTAISSSTGYTGGGLYYPFAIAIDGAGNPWVANYGSNTVSEFANDGTPISPATGFAGGNLVSPQAIAIDGSGNVWIANGNWTTLTELIGAAAPVVTPIAAALKNNALGARP